MSALLDGLVQQFLKPRKKVTPTPSADHEQFAVAMFDGSLATMAGVTVTLNPDEVLELGTRALLADLELSNQSFSGSSFPWIDVACTPEERVTLMRGLKSVGCGIVAAQHNKPH